MKMKAHWTDNYQICSHRFEHVDFARFTIVVVTVTELLNDTCTRLVRTQFDNFLIDIPKLCAAVVSIEKWPIPKLNNDSSGFN